MDPIYALKTIEELIVHGKRRTAFGYAIDLMNWIDARGFAPDWDDYPIASAFIEKRFNRKLRSDEVFA